jgi:riboflavin kinase / FMN adenylyltransferase
MTMTAFPVLRDGDAVSPALSGAVVAIGNFDGVHRGHQRVIATALAMARERDRPALALTFEPHPASFFAPHVPFFRLTPEPLKVRALQAAGLSGAVVMAFDARLAAEPPDLFIDLVLRDRLAVSGVAVGYDFHFGKARAGTPSFLKASGDRHGFAVEIVPRFTDGGTTISSSAIRAALEAGDAALAATLLGRPYAFIASVRHGDKRGRDLGFPTANLALEPGNRLRQGIYAVRVVLPDGRCVGGAASYGRRPTFDNGAPLFEVYLFDFAGDLYGATLMVEVIGWVRPELKFDGVDALVAQMREDCDTARRLISAMAPS